MARLTKWERQRNKFIVAQAKRIDDIYKTAAREAAAIGASLRNVNPDKIFSFSDYPSTKKRVDDMIQELKENLSVTIIGGIRNGWTIANNKNSELCNQVFGKDADKLPDAMRDRYYNTNAKAQEAFIQRKVGGLRLSDRVWNYSNQFKNEIELGLDIGIRSGKSADAMARDLKQYLRFPDKLFRRVRDEHGELQLSKNAQAFHPGRGVYRSSYKNARRLAVTESNIAYHTADYLRWQQLDFVVGIMIEPSYTNHEPDVCDDLKGKYPKDFKFTGWHPHCRCHALTILKTPEEMDADTKRILNGEEPIQPDMEDYDFDGMGKFNSWIDKNRERAKGWETMPYFVRDNPQYVKNFRVDTYSAAERKFTRCYHTSPAMQASMSKYLQKKYPHVENTEKAAIYDYTRGDVSDFRQLNNQLRKGNLSEFNVAFSELLSSALSKIPTEKATVYRTVRLNKTRLAEHVGWAEEQTKTEFLGYTSTSKSRSVVEEMMTKKGERINNNEKDVLYVIKGKTGHPINDFSMFDGKTGLASQKELLFDKGCHFRFDRYEVSKEGRFIFYLTEL